MITIYSKDNCPQCLMAENLLKLKGKEYRVLKLDKDYTREQLAELTSIRSFPIILKEDSLVGDLNALKKAVATGTL